MVLLLFQMLVQLYLSIRRPTSAVQVYLVLSLVAVLVIVIL